MTLKGFEVGGNFIGKIAGNSLKNAKNVIEPTKKIVGLGTTIGAVTGLFGPISPAILTAKMFKYLVMDKGIFRRDRGGKGQSLLDNIKITIEFNRNNKDDER